MRGKTWRPGVTAALCALAVVAAPTDAAHALSFDTTTYPAGSFPFSIAAADFNGDSDLDLAVTNWDGDNVSILLGGPGATFTAPANVPAGDRPIGIATADFNGDTDPDLAVANNAGSNVSILLGGPGGSFGAPSNFTTAGGPEHIAVGDFDGDSNRDLAVAARFQDKVSVLPGAGGGSFGFRVNYDVLSDPIGIAAADFNGDTDLDLAVTNHVAAPNISILEGQAGGAFAVGTPLSAGDRPVGIAVGEFNGDSDPDLAVTNYLSGTASVLLGTSGSGFTAPVDYPTHNGPHSVAIGDLNGDSDPDLAVANAVGDNLTVLLGGAGSAFTDDGDYAVADSPRSVITRDFNQDGRLDLAMAANPGVVVFTAVDAPTFSIDDVRRAEGHSGETDFTFTITASGVTSEPMQVTWRTVDGTATAAGNDYTAVAPQTLNFARNETAKTVTVKVQGDTAIEDDELFGVELSDAVNAAIGDGTGTGIIVDDDHPGYPRPKGASPVRVSLVQAYRACTSPNRTHGPPLAFGSCSPPQPVNTLSGQLTVGTGDANGAAANSVGTVRLATIAGDPGTPVDEADMRIEMSITDVRRRSDLTDYTGELELLLPARLTDRLGSSFVPDETLTTDFVQEVAVPCAATGSTAIGSTCSLTTTLEGIVGGAVTEGKRSIWAFDQIRVNDAGSDGVAGNGSSSLFATQGIFIP